MKYKSDPWGMNDWLTMCKHCFTFKKKTLEYINIYVCVGYIYIYILCMNSYVKLYNFGSGIKSVESSF